MAMMRKARNVICSALMIALLVPVSVHRSYADEHGTIKSEQVDFRIQRVTKGLQMPWAIAFLPDGKALVSDRAAGHIGLVDLNDGEVTPLAGGPNDVFIKKNAGMLDVVLHPDFTNNSWVYYSYTAGDDQIGRAHV